MHDFIFSNILFTHFLFPDKFDLNKSRAFFYWNEAMRYSLVMSHLNETRLAISFQTYIKTHLAFRYHLRGAAHPFRTPVFINVYNGQCSSTLWNWTPQWNGIREPSAFSPQTYRACVVITRKNRFNMLPNCWRL